MSILTVLFSPNIKRMKERHDVKGLIKALQHKDYYFRMEAAEALGQLKDACAVEPLIAALKDEEHLVRTSAADALGNLKDSRAIEPLIGALRDRHARDRAAWALGAMDAIFTNDSDKIAYFISRYDVEECLKFGKSVVEPLLAEIKDDRGDYNYQAKVMRALGKLKDPRAAELLNSLILGDKDVPSWQQRSLGYWELCAAIQALGEIGDPRALEALLVQLEREFSAHDGDLYCIQVDAIEALGKIGDYRAITPIVVFLKRLHNFAKDAIAQDPSCVSIGNTFLNGLEKAAIETLGKINDYRAITPLFNFFIDFGLCPKESVLCSDILRAIHEIRDARAVDLIDLLVELQEKADDKGQIGKYERIYLKKITEDLKKIKENSRVIDNSSVKNE
jgi:HEAT repeat protein